MTLDNRIARINERVEETAVRDKNGKLVGARQHPDKYGWYLRVYCGRRE